MTLPVMLSEHGEVVRLVTADHLLQAASLHDLTDAELEQLATFTENADHLAAISREAKGRVSDELIRRLDRRGKWTLRDSGFEVKAPSPTAGTVSYDTDKLRETLLRLVETDLIDKEAATAALDVVVPEPYWKQKPAGIAALLKRGGDVAAAVKECQVESEPPRRVARVKRSAA